MKPGILLTGMLLSWTAVVWAQTPGTLTFTDAVKIGLQNNVDLNQQKNQLEYTQINKTSSLLQLGPSVQADASAYRVDGNSFNQQTGEVVNGLIDYINGSVSASMPIFNGLRQTNFYRQARSQNEAQLHQVARSQQDVIRDVANQYLLCLLDQQLIRINEQNVEAQRVQYGQIKAQVDLGSSAEADLINQEYQLKNAELLLLRSQNTLKNDLAILAQTIQIDPATPFALQEVDWRINEQLADTLTLEGMYAVALGRRSDLKQAEESEKAARFGYQAAKGLYYPSLYAGASYGSRFNYVHDADNRPFKDQFFTDNRNFSYGVSLTIPIYNGLQFRNRAALVRADYKNAQLQRSSAEITVKTDVIRAHQNFRDAITAYQTAESQLRAAEISYQMEKERYELGISNVVQLAVVNQSFVKAQGDLESARYTLMFQRLLINYALGTLRLEDIP